MNNSITIIVLPSHTNIFFLSWRLLCDAVKEGTDDTSGMIGLKLHAILQNVLRHSIHSLC